MIAEQKVLNCLALEINTNKRLFPNRSRISYQRLMLFMYLVQGVYLSVYKKPLFNDQIVHGANEPYCQKIIAEKGMYPKVQKLINEDHIIPDGQDVLNDNQACLIIRSVFNAYNAVDTPTLLVLVKKQEPWQATATGDIISDNAMKSYFNRIVNYHN